MLSTVLFKCIPFACPFKFKFAALSDVMLFTSVSVLLKLNVLPVVSKLLSGVTATAVFDVLPKNMLPSSKFGVWFVLNAPCTNMWLGETTLPIFCISSSSPVGMVVVKSPDVLTYKSAPCVRLWFAKFITPPVATCPSLLAVIFSFTIPNAGIFALSVLSAKSTCG